MRQTLTKLKGETNSNRKIVGDFSTLLSIMNRTTRPKINREIADFNNAVDQVDLTEIHRTFYPTGAETHFSLVHMQIFQDRE